MALAAPFPPWLNIGPETFTGAMAAGSKLGLGARAEDIRQETAADRLQLAYQQLASKEGMAQQALQGRMALANAQMELRDKTLDLNASMRSRALDQQMANIDSLMKYRDFQERLKGGKSNIHWDNGQPYSYNEETGQMELVPGVAPRPPKESPERITIDPAGNVSRSMGPKEYARVKGIAHANALARQAQSQLPSAPPNVGLKPEEAVASPNTGGTMGILRDLFGKGSPSALTPTPAPTAKGKIFPDKNGKKWRYLGDLADPKKDRDESHWEMVE